MKSKKNVLYRRKPSEIDRFITKETMSSTFSVQIKHKKNVGEKILFTRFIKVLLSTDLFTIQHLIFFRDQFKAISILLFLVKVQVPNAYVLNFNCYMIFLMENLFSNFPTYYCITYGNDSKLDLFRNCVVFLTPFNMANTGV